MNELAFYAAHASMVFERAQDFQMKFMAEIIHVKG